MATNPPNSSPPTNVDDPNASPPNTMTPAAQAIYDQNLGTRINPYAPEANQAQTLADYEQNTDVVNISNSNPHKTDDYSPLDLLVSQCLRRYGNFASGTIDAATRLMLLEFANNTIEDLRLHPYWDDKNIRYYKSMSDRRPVPDEIIRAGLIFYYADQQSSSKQQGAGAQYYRRLNAMLYERKYGDQRIKLIPMDGGTRPLNQPLPEKAWDGMRLRDPIQGN